MDKEPKLFFPHPINRVRFEVDPDNPAGPPGDYELTPTGKLLKSAIDYDGVTGDVIEDYNTLVLGKGTHSINHTMTSTKLLVVTPNVSKYMKSKEISKSEFEILGGSSKLSGNLKNTDYRREIYLIFNSIKFKSPSGKIKFPFQFRDSHESYMATLSVELGIEVVEYVGGIKKIHKYVPKDIQNKIYATVGKFPIMTGSKLDNLTEITPKSRWISYGEDPRDPLSQFIIGGNHYTLFLRESLRPNRIFNYSTKKAGKISSLTSSSPRYTRYVKLIINKFGEIGVRIYSNKDIAKSKIEKYPDSIMNVFTFCRFMFGVSQRDILAYIRSFSNKHVYQKIYNYLRITIEKDNNHSDTLVHIGALMGDVVTNDKRTFLSEKYKNTYNKDMYPHIDHKFKLKKDINTHKFVLLMLQTTRYVEYLIMVRPSDDKNSWYNKSIINPSISIHQQFNNVWNNIVSELSSKLEQKFSTIANYNIDLGDVSRPDNINKYRNILNEARNILTKFEGKSGTGIGKRFETCFKNKTWSPRKTHQKRDDGRSELIQRGESLMSRYSIATKIVSPAPDESRDMAIRDVHRTSLGIEDITQSPESQKCGLIKVKASTCWISIQRDDSEIIKNIKESEVYIPVNRPPPFSERTACLVNGIFIGWTNGDKVVQLIKNKKYNGYYDKDVSVNYMRDDNTVYVHSDRSRPTRPLLVVSNNELLIDKMKLWNSDFDTLLEKGAIEYVDVWELYDKRIAVDVDEVRNYKRKIQKVNDEYNLLISRYNTIFGELPKSIKHKPQTYEYMTKKLENEKKELDTLIEKSKTAIINIKQIINDTTNKYESLIDAYNKANSEDKPKIQKEIVSFIKSLFPSITTNITQLRAKGFYEYYIRRLYGKIELLQTQIRNHRDKISENTTDITRYRTFNPNHISNIIKTSISNIDKRIISVLNYIQKGFGKKMKDSDRLMIMSTNIPQIINVDDLMNSIFDHEMELIIDHETYINKQKYYSDVISRFNDILESIVKIRKENDSQRFILVKRYLNSTRIKLLAYLGTLGNTLDKLEDIINKQKGVIESKSIKYDKYTTNVTKLSLKERNEIKTSLYKDIQFIEKELRVISRREISYSELDPNAVHGINVSLIPAWNHNDNVRNAYAATQGMQALAGISPSDLLNFPTTAKRLLTAERPIFVPQGNRFFGIDETPYGQMVLMAVVDLGWNREDSMIIRERSITEQGKFMMVIYKTHTLLLNDGSKEDQKINYIFGVPKGAKKNKSYINLDEKGLAKVGSYIKVGDVIIGRYIITRSKDGKEEYQDASELAVIGEDGIVDRASITYNKDGVEVANVRIRKIRPPKVGDKFATRSAQKMVISRIAKDDELPKTEGLGMIPDVYINPLAFPSRMTINHLIEMLASLHGTLTGRRIDATAFTKYNISRWKNSLIKYGMNPSGKQKFIDPKTGTKIAGEIFTGPVYLQALGHHVDDKIQFRSTGNVDPMTRRPIGGRKAGSGIKLGEMERDALISHGAQNVLRERTCISGGGHTGVWCKECGIMAGIKEEDIKSGESVFKCRKCGTRDKSKLGVCTIPYVLKTTADHIAGMGIKLKLNFVQ